MILIVTNLSETIMFNFQSNEGDLFISYIYIVEQDEAALAYSGNGIDLICRLFTQSQQLHTLQSLSVV